jgi:hypothetical protein
MEKTQLIQKFNKQAAKYAKNVKNKNKINGESKFSSQLKEKL